jgi:hypothetical protein
MTEPSQSPDPSQTKATAVVRQRDADFWIALSALVVSALAMLSSLLQVSLLRSQERALVWPHVSARPSYSAQGFRFVAKNKGLGPALVRNVTLKVDGKPVENWQGVIGVMLGDNAKAYGWDKVQVNELADTILDASESVNLFGIGWDPTTSAAFQSGNRISVEICYCSVLDDCWISQTGLDHMRVSRCLPAARER